MKAYITNRAGGPEVLQLQELPDPVAQKGEVRIRIRAFGINRPEVDIQRKHPRDGCDDDAGGGRFVRANRSLSTKAAIPRPIPPFADGPPSRRWPSSSRPSNRPTKQPRF